MNTITILYIDDKPDLDLSKYFDCYAKENHLEYIEERFNSEIGYKRLLTSEKVEKSNIIFIDSKLFEDASVTKKFNGEELKLILKKFFPFIEIFIITQNKIEGIKVIHKYDSSKDGSDAEKYYKATLDDKIKEAIENIKEYKSISLKMKENKEIPFEVTTLEQIYNSINGIHLYEELSKKDIDEIILQFKKIEKELIKK